VIVWVIEWDAELFDDSMVALSEQRAPSQHNTSSRHMILACGLQQSTGLFARMAQIENSTDASHCHGWEHQASKPATAVRQIGRRSTFNATMTLQVFKECTFWSEPDAESSRRRDSGVGLGCAGRSKHGSQEWRRRQRQSMVKPRIAHCSEFCSTDGGRRASRLARRQRALGAGSWVLGRELQAAGCRCHLAESSGQQRAAAKRHASAAAARVR
jgi:hypothetical protein